MENVLQYFQPSYSIKQKIWYGEGIEKEMKIEKKKKHPLKKT